MIMHHPHTTPALHPSHTCPVLHPHISAPHTLHGAASHFSLMPPPHTRHMRRTPHSTGPPPHSSYRIYGRDPSVIDTYYISTTPCQSARTGIEALDTHLRQPRLRPKCHLYRWFSFSNLCRSSSYQNMCILLCSRLCVPCVQNVTCGLGAPCTLLGIYCCCQETCSASSSELQRASRPLKETQQVTHCSFQKEETRPHAGMCTSGKAGQRRGDAYPKPTPVSVVWQRLEQAAA